MLLAIVLIAQTSLQAQLRIFRKRGIPSPQKRVNAAHEKAKTEADKSYQKGDYARAANLTTTVILENPQDHVAYYLRASARAEIAIQKRDTKLMRSAVADAREAIRLDGTKNPMYYLPYLYGMTNLSAIENRDEHAKVAVSVATQAIGIRTLKPEDQANLYYQRAMSYSYLKQYSKAAADFASTVRLSPSHLGAHVGAADAYASAGDVKNATAAYERSVRAFPNNPLIFNNRGMFLQQQGKLSDAIVDFTRAIELDSKYFYAYTNRGYCSFQMGDPKAAEADYDTSLKINAAQSTVYGLRAAARLAQGDVNGAVEDNRSVVRLTPQNPAAHADLGFALFFAADYAGADRAFGQALAINANQPHLAPWRFLALERTGRKNEALRRYAASLKKDRADQNWVDAILVYLSGKTTSDELLKSIDMKNTATKTAQICEAHFFIGLREKDATKAKTNFQKAIVRLLLKHNADPNVASGPWQTRPIFETENPTVVKLLIEQGASLTGGDQDERTPLEAAARRGLQSVARVLEAKGAKVDARSAAFLGWTTQLKSFLRRDSRLAARDFELLFAAAGAGHTETVRLLLKHGANPNHNFGFFNAPGRYTPLSEAVRKGRYDVAKLLCEHGASPNVSAGRGHQSLLLFAIAYRDVRFLKLLIQHRAEFNRCEALHVAAALGGANDAGHTQRQGEPRIPEWLDRQSVQKAQLLIESGADVNAPSQKHDATPLLIAAIAENKPLVALLKQRGAKHDLYSACALGDLTVVQTLIQEDPQRLKRKTHPFGRSALHWAVRSGNIEIVRLLVKHGISIRTRAPELEHQAAGGFDTAWRNVVRNGKQTEDRSRAETPLHTALSRHHTAIARLLIMKHADIEARDANDRTPLMIAAATGNVEAVKLLIARGADVNAHSDDSWTALHEGIKSRNIVELLLQAGAKVNVGLRNESPIQLAAELNGRRDVAELLLKHGATLDIVTACTLNRRAKVAEMLKRNPKLLHAKYSRWLSSERLIEIASQAGAVDVVRLLIDKGALRPRAKVGVHPLHAAAASGHQNVVEVLIKKGVSLEARNVEGRTPLHMAAITCELEMVKSLIRLGANVNATDHKGATPLHHAGGDEWSMFDQDAATAATYRRRARDVAHLLIEAGARVDARNGEGMTPLHLAAVKGQTEVVKLLLKKGAPINAFDWSVRTPLAIAEQKDHDTFPDAVDRSAVVELLKTRGAIK
eukprot:g8408.t1